MATMFECNHLQPRNFAKMCYICICLKVKKFQVCVRLRLGSVEENIEGDASLHHSLGIQLCKIKMY